MTRCPNCQREVPTWVDTCLGCGAALVPEDPISAPRWQPGTDGRLHPAEAPPPPAGAVRSRPTRGHTHSTRLFNQHEEALLAPPGSASAAGPQLVRSCMLIAVAVALVGLFFAGILLRSGRMPPAPTPVIAQPEVRKFPAPTPEAAPQTPPLSEPRLGHFQTTPANGAYVPPAGR